jgi:RHS repeat-associated protein
MIRQENWHREELLEAPPPAVYEPQYNERGLLRSETLTVQGRRNQAIVDIQYDAKDQRTRIEYGNNTVTRYYYDEKTFRLLQLRTSSLGAETQLPTPPSNLNSRNVLQNLYYTYDPSGNITEIQDDAYQPEFFQNQIIEPRHEYTYDAVYRLIEATGRENGPASGPPSHLESPTPRVTFPVTSAEAIRKYTQRYSYDSVGNIMQVAHSAGTGSWTRRYRYEERNNRLFRTWTGADEWENAGPTNRTEYRYDTHGSMLNLANVASGQFLRWDTRDMIHSLDLEGGGGAFYNYDASKQRTRKRVEKGNEVEERLYLGGMEHYRRWLNDRLVEEIETHHLFVDEQRVLIVENVIETSSDLPRGVFDRYQYSNHLGSVGLELDGDGKVISYEEYHPYGTTAYWANSSEVKARVKRYRYTGMERDEESGLSYHTARYYLSWLGRWGSADPAQLAGGVNMYAFLSGNPLNRIDPNGTQDYDPDTHTSGGERLSEPEIDVISGRSSPLDDLNADPPRLDIDMDLPERRSAALTRLISGHVPTQSEIWLSLPRAIFDAVIRLLDQPQQSIGDAAASFFHPYIPPYAYRIPDLGSTGGYTDTEALLGQVERTAWGGERLVELTNWITDRLLELVVEINSIVPALGPTGAVAAEVVTRAPAAELPADLRSALIRVLRARQRVLELAEEAGGHIRIREALGGHRFEIATGRRLRASLDPDYDFIDDVLGEIDIKGPLRRADGSQLQITDDMVRGLAESVVTEVNTSSASRAVVVDLLGLTDSQVEMVREIVSTGIRVSKPIIMLR